MSSAFKPVRKLAGSFLDPVLGVADKGFGMFGLGDDGGGSSFADVLKGLANPLLSGAPIPASTESPPEMPIAPGAGVRNAAAARAANRRSQERQRGRRGRRSTILTPFSVESEGLLGE